MHRIFACIQVFLMLLPFFLATWQSCCFEDGDDNAKNNSNNNELDAEATAFGQGYNFGQFFPPYPRGSPGPQQSNSFWQGLGELAVRGKSQRPIP